MTPAENSGTTSGTDPGGASIHGTIEFRDVGEPKGSVTVYVRVQDTGHADAPASTVAEQVLTGVSIASGSPTIAFTVTGIPPNPRARYSIRVHADVDGDRTVSRGDYVSTQSYGVPAGGAATALAIVVHEVR
jgi:uncharacterized lipoprotein YbaY